MYFAKKFVIISVIQVRPVIFFPPNFVKHYQTSKAPSSCFALEQDKFLSVVKTVQILPFARHDLKKKFLSAPTITKLNIWQRHFVEIFGRAKQILSVRCVRAHIEVL